MHTFHDDDRAATRPRAVHLKIALVLVCGAFYGSAAIAACSVSHEAEVDAAADAGEAGGADAAGAIDVGSSDVAVADAGTDADAGPGDDAPSGWPWPWVDGSTQNLRYADAGTCPDAWTAVWTEPSRCDVDGAADAPPPYCANTFFACLQYACSCSGHVMIGCYAFTHPYGLIIPVSAAPAPDAACDPYPDAGAD